MLFAVHLLLSAGSDADNEEISVTIKMPFDGDMTIEASNSPTFTVEAIQAFYPIDLSTPIGITADNLNSLTIRALSPGTDIIFKIIGQGEGIFEIVTSCRSNNPSPSPTTTIFTPNPTMDTIHSQPSPSTRAHQYQQPLIQ